MTLKDMSPSKTARSEFNAQPELASGLLALRPLKPEDFDGLFAAAGHPEVWAGHPAKDRHKRNVFEEISTFS